MTEQALSPRDTRKPELAEATEVRGLVRGFVRGAIDELIGSPDQFALISDTSKSEEHGGDGQWHVISGFTPNHIRINVSRTKQTDPAALDATKIWVSYHMAVDAGGVRAQANFTEGNERLDLFALRDDPKKIGREVMDDPQALADILALFELSIEDARSD